MEGLCFTVLHECCQVLDNLPHDLVCKPAVSSPWLEVAISEDCKGYDLLLVARLITWIMMTA